MWLIHHISENLILNQGCSQKYYYNENIHVDNNKIRTLEIMREKRGITVRRAAVRSILLAKRLKRLSYCDVLYHEQIHSECLLIVMLVLPCKITFV